MTPLVTYPCVPYLKRESRDAMIARDSSLDLGTLPTSILVPTKVGSRYLRPLRAAGYSTVRVPYPLAKGSSYRAGIGRYCTSTR